MGDAVCSFNPIYGQGITVSALEAMALSHLLQEQDHNELAVVSARFRQATAAIVDTPWRLTTTEDLRHPDAVGARPIGTALLHWYTGRLHAGCADNAALALAFYRVMHMLDAPAALFRPKILWHILCGSRACWAQAPAHSVRKPSEVAESRKGSDLDAPKRRLQ
jgi:hypothetical protein